MKKHILVLLLVGGMLPLVAPAQITNVVVLNAEETGRLQRLIRENEGARQLYDSIAALADSHLQQQPRPLPQLFYEGMLPTHPDRVRIFVIHGSIFLNFRNLGACKT